MGILRCSQRYGNGEKGNFGALSHKCESDAKCAGRNFGKRANGCILLHLVGWRMASRRISSMHRRIGIIDFICTRHQIAIFVVVSIRPSVRDSHHIGHCIRRALVNVLLSMPKRARPIRDIVAIIKLRQVQKTVTLALVRGWIGQDPNVCMSYRP